MHEFFFEVDFVFFEGNMTWLKFALRNLHLFILSKACHLSDIGTRLRILRSQA